MTFDAFMVEFYTQLRVLMVNHDWRPGQIFFNLLWDHRPDLAEQIRGQYEIDPFYRDDYLPAAIDRVRALWTPRTWVLDLSPLDQIAQRVVTDLGTVFTGMKIQAIKELRNRCKLTGHEMPSLLDSKNAIDAAIERHK